VALDPAFLADCPYLPDAVLFDELLAVDREAGAVRARLPAHDALPLTRDQRAHATRHPRHVAGGLMVHATGMLGFMHAYYVLDLRHAAGWIGYGTHIHQARFRRLARVDAPLEGECRQTQLRKIRGQLVARYAFAFRQGGELVYEGDQTAVWTRVEAA
jgi:hypothetical protein